MDEFLEVVAITGLGSGAFALTLSAVGRLVLWMVRADVPPAREAFNPLSGGNPHRGALGMLAHMLRPGSILVAVGIVAFILRGVAEIW